MIRAARRHQSAPPSIHGTRRSAPGIARLVDDALAGRTPSSKGYRSSRPAERTDARRGGPVRSGCPRDRRRRRTSCPEPSTGWTEYAPTLPTTRDGRTSPGARERLGRHARFRAGRAAVRTGGAVRNWRRLRPARFGSTARDGRAAARGSGRWPRTRRAAPRGTCPGTSAPAPPGQHGP